MAMQVFNTTLPPNSGWGVNGYVLGFVGDGTSTTVSVNLFDYISCDPGVPSKTPTGIQQINVPSGDTAPTGTLSGTILTLTWATALYSGATQPVGIVLTFSA